MADEARLNEILDLVEQARSEGDKDTEAKAVAAYKRESAPQPFPDTYGGAGGYNPMLPRIAGATNAFAKPLGVTPENSVSPIKNAFGPLESVTQAGSGLAGAIGGGLAGIGQGAWNLVTPKSMNGPDAADRVRQVQDAVTYQPRTASGAGLSRVAGAPQEAYSAGTNYLGEKATDITGSPLIGAAIKTGGDAVPMVFGGKAAPETRAVQAGEKYTRKSPYEVPTTEELRSAANAAYKSSKESGVVVPADGYAGALDSVRSMVKDEGLDPTLHPKSSAVMKRLEEASGKDLTLQEAETLRKIAMDAEDDLNPVTRQPTPDARIAGKIVDQLDESIDALDFNSDARAMWSRMKKSQMVDQMVHRAEIRAGAHYTQAGMEHALRQEFKTLAMNPRRMRGLNAEQKAAIEKVAKGGPMENTLRTLGKFDPTSGPIAALASIGTGAVTGGVLPLAGFFGKRAATRATTRNVDLARQMLVGRAKPIVPKAQNISPQQIMANKMAGTLKIGEDYAPPSFQPSGGVMPSRAAASNGFELQPQGFLGSQQFPPAPSRLTADVPAALQGGLPFTPTRLPNDIAAQLSGGLDIAKPAQKYPGGIDFTPPSMAPQMAGDLRLGDYAGETPAIPAKAPEGASVPPSRPAKRTQKDVLGDIRRVEAIAKKLTPDELADSSYTAAISQELARLHAELVVRAPRAAKP